jgi:CRISPR/Cas system-associated exonuclease Cas4 (RecB family)
MDISIDEIMEYLFCPTRYNLRYRYDIPIEREENVEYKKAIHKTISYLYYSMLGERLPSAKQMKDKWASIWTESTTGQQNFKDKLFEDRGSRDPRKTTRTKSDKYIIEGYEMIHNFYHFNQDDFGIPIAVDKEFRVPVGNINITGKFELIRESIDKSTSNRFIEIVDFKTGPEEKDQFMIQNDFRLTIMSYAFRNLFNSEEDRLVLNYLKTGSQVYTTRGEKDYSRMKAIIEGVAEGIVNERFYPRQSFMCKSCPFKDACGLVNFK